MGTVQDLVNLVDRGPGDISLVGRDRLLKEMSDYPSSPDVARLEDTPANRDKVSVDMLRFHDRLSERSLMTDVTLDALRSQVEKVGGGLDRGAMDLTRGANELRKVGEYAGDASTRSPVLRVASAAKGPAGSEAAFYAAATRDPAGR